MVEKIETEVDKLLLILIMIKKFPIYIYISKIQLFFNFENKSTLLEMFVTLPHFYYNFVS